MIQLTTELVDNGDYTWTLKLVGSVDSDTRHLMWSVESSQVLLEKLLEAKATELSIDLALADQFDSHGLRLLLNAQKEFSKENVQIILKNPNSHLKRLFQIMLFDRVFTIDFDDEQH
jgi:anti-anti-sigma factor